MYGFYRIRECKPREQEWGTKRAKWFSWESHCENVLLSWLPVGEFDYLILFDHLMRSYVLMSQDSPLGGSKGQGFINKGILHRVLNFPPFQVHLQVFRSILSPQQGSTRAAHRSTQHWREERYVSRSCLQEGYCSSHRASSCSDSSSERKVKSKKISGRDT